MANHQPIKLSYFDANLKLSFVFYNNKCSIKNDMLRYERESQSFIIVNKQNLTNDRFKKIQVSDLESIDYYIVSDIDVIEIGDKSDSTNSLSCISNTFYLRFMRLDVFCDFENDWYDVIFRPRCNDDLSVLLIYLKEVVNTTVSIN